MVYLFPFCVLFNVPVFVFIRLPSRQPCFISDPDTSTNALQETTTSSSGKNGSPATCRVCKLWVILRRNASFVTRKQESRPSVCPQQICINYERPTPMKSGPTVSVSPLSPISFHTGIDAISYFLSPSNGVYNRL